MTIGSLFASVVEKLRQGPFGQEQEEPNLSTGGTSGYHPPVSKPKRRPIMRRPAAPAAGTAPQQAYVNYAGPQAGYPQQQGFPQQNYPQQANNGGFPQQTPAPQPAVSGGFTPQPVPMGSGYQGAFQRSGEENAYSSNWPHAAETPYESKWQRPQQQTPVSQPQPPVPNNVSYMPNLYVDEHGDAFRHVERLTQPMSASTCYRLIEFMRNGETVIVNTELIQDERENQRCLDLLYGAAYTMGCTFTRISAKSIYVIAPSTVSVIPYESIRQINERDQASRWPGAESFARTMPPKRTSVFGGFRAAGQ